jgi:quercetin dioxygenase-like cupin family protein
MSNGRTRILVREKVDSATERYVGMRYVRLLALIAAAVSTVWCPAQASATPNHDVTSTLLNQSTLNGHDYITREIIIAPGGSTGWHWHDGELIAVVKQGTLTHNMSDCSIDGVYNAGDPVIEAAGPDHVHIGRNLGAIPMILQVIYVDPVGKPLAEDAANPGCNFS